MKHISRSFTLIKMFLKKLDDDSVAAYSAQTAFFVMLSFFPFLMLLLTLINYVPFNLEETRLFTLDLLSPSITGFVTQLVEEIYRKASGAVISVTTITALWSASRGILALIKGLNNVYGAVEKRGYFRLRATSAAYVLVFAAAIISMLGLFVFGGIIFDWLSGISNQIALFLSSVLRLRWLFGPLILILFFMFIYTIIPERKTKFKNELPGAVISAAGWILFSALYSYYVEHWSNYSYLYGSLTTIVLLMLWLYMCMYILFAGAEINNFFRNPDVKTFIKNWHTEHLAKKILRKKH